VLDRDRHAVALVPLEHLKLGVQLAVPLADRVEVGAPELLRGELAPLEQPERLLGGEAQRVDHAAPSMRESRRERIIHGCGAISESHCDTDGTKPTSSTTCCSAIQRTGIMRPARFTSVTPKCASPSKTPAVWLRS